MSNTDNFTTQLCNNLGCTAFPATYNFINTWASYEDTSAENNPLASEWKDGSTNFNSAGVQNYPSIVIGAQATAADLKAWPKYATIVAAIKSGGPFNTTDVIGGINYWGTDGFATFLLLGGKCTNGFTSPGISNTTPTPTPAPNPIIQENLDLSNITKSISKTNQVNVFQVDPNGGLWQKWQLVGASGWSNVQLNSAATNCSGSGAVVADYEGTCTNVYAQLATNLHVGHWWQWDNENVWHFEEMP
jgi:hypothetical protein